MEMPCKLFLYLFLDHVTCFLLEVKENTSVSVMLDEWFPLILFCVQKSFEK